MNLNKNDLKKIIYEFNSKSNRLLQADFEDYSNVLSKYVRYLQETELIHDYIFACGEIDYDIEAEIKEVSGSCGCSIFVLGKNDTEEIRNVYAIIKYISDNQIQIIRGIGMSYTSSRKFQDMVKGFNERVVMVLLRHIECYLTKIGIEMGMDDTIKYSIKVTDGQVNIASDNAVINATQNNYIDIKKFYDLLSAVKVQSETILSPDDKISVSESLDTIEYELKHETPKKSLVNTSLKVLYSIKGTTEFLAAVTSLVQFVQTIIK